MATHHVRPSHHSKKATPVHARPSKPDPLSKRSLSSGKGNHNSKSTHRKEVESEDDESMAVSFLNYWYAIDVCKALSTNAILIQPCSAVCEKQIIVPSNAVLYCSQRYDDPSLLPAWRRILIHTQLPQEGYRKEPYRSIWALFSAGNTLRQPFSRRPDLPRHCPSTIAHATRVKAFIMCILCRLYRR